MTSSIPEQQVELGCEKDCNSQQQGDPEIELNCSAEVVHLQRFKLFSFSPRLRGNTSRSACRWSRDTPFSCPLSCGWEWDKYENQPGNREALFSLPQ